MSVIFNYCTGHLSQVQSELRRAFAQYSRHNDYIKIGITNDPSRRWREHLAERKKENDKWEKMIVVFETSSRKIAGEAETMLIEYARYCKHFEKVWNDCGGGDGPEANCFKKYYVYFLLGKDS